MRPIRKLIIKGVGTVENTDGMAKNTLTQMTQDVTVNNMFYLIP